jgi:hypothetical protein
MMFARTFPAIIAGCALSAAIVGLVFGKEITKPAKSRSGSPGYTDYSYSPGTDYSYSPGYSASYSPGYTDYYYPINQSIDRLTSTVERSAIPKILVELNNKTYLELASLKLAPDVCREIACLGASTETVRRYVEEYSAMRIAADNHETAVRSAAASETSIGIALASAGIAFFALLISGATFWRAGRLQGTAAPK